MVIGNLDLASVTFAKLKTDSPTAVDGHGPLISAIAFQLVQADASRRTNITERLDDIQSRSRSTAASKASPWNRFGRSPSQTFRVTELRHDRTMAKIYYAKQ